MDEWAARGDVWVDVSQRVANAGFTEISAVRDQISGGVERVRLRVEAFGDAQDRVEVTIHGPDGREFLRDGFEPWVNREQVVEFAHAAPGTYRIAISPGGAYRYDDLAEIVVPATQDVRVDWQVGARDLVSRLGWIDDGVAPALRVVSAAPAIDDRPLLMVGAGYRRGSPVTPIGDYVAHPLLSALNFDVAERAGMLAAPSLRPGFEPVMRGAGGAVWIARRSDPPAAYVPGLPLDGDDNLARFSMTVFLNAARWVLQRRPLEPLFRLTTLSEPEPEGNRLALHPGEGNTARTPRSIGRLEFESSSTSEATPAGQRIWPYFVLAALAVFVAERYLVGYRAWAS
jgi:hypothetical protein